jgi:hypothetical protein
MDGCIQEELTRTKPHARCRRLGHGAAAKADGALAVGVPSLC